MTATDRWWRNGSTRPPTATTLSQFFGVPSAGPAYLGNAGQADNEHHQQWPIGVGLWHHDVAHWASLASGAIHAQPGINAQQHHHVCRGPIYQPPATSWSVKPGAICRRHLIGTRARRKTCNMEMASITPRRLALQARLLSTLPMFSPRHFCRNQARDEQLQFYLNGANNGNGSIGALDR